MHHSSTSPSAQSRSLIPAQVSLPKTIPREPSGCKYPSQILFPRELALRHYYTSIALAYILNMLLI